jgi:concanavalin A-like lectin/glucanase superfamily protein
MTVSVLYSEARHGSGTQLTLTGSDVIVTSISSSSLTAGHRYLVLASIIFAGSGRQQADLKFGGTADTNLRGIYANPSGGSGLKSHKAMTVWTAVASQNIELTAKFVTTGGVARNASIMAIDLDSGGLTEDVDWYHVVETNRSEHVHHAFTEPAAVIECQAASTLVDGETFTINDGDGHIVTFEFDLAGNGVTSGNTAITLSPAATQATVRTTMRTAIDASALSVFTADQGSTAFMLVRPDGGDVQKITITDTVANATFVFGQWNPAVLTFTPDGYSDYLIIGGARLDVGGGLNHCIMRLRDVTSNTTICQAGIGSGNIGTEEHCLWGWGTLTAPASTQRSIVTQYRSFPDWQKDEARIVAIRLNAFKNYSYFDTSINAVPAGTTRTSQGTISITPAANGELVIFGAVQSQSKTGFDTTARGVAGAVELAGVSIWDTNSSITPSVSYDDGSDNYNGLDGSRVGPFIFKKVTGQSETAKTVELFRTAASTVSDNTLQQMALLAFTTQEFLFLPAAVIGEFPVNNSTSVAQNANLSWSPADGGGDITYDVFFGDGYEDVIGELESAFLGNISDTSFNIPILQPNHTYYWSINPINDAGTTYGEIFTFTTGDDADADLAFNPSPENGATLIEIPTVTLMWDYGAATDTFNVYFSTSDELLDGYALISEEQASNTIDIFDLDFRQTYYWRIDTVGSGGVTTGDVWNFSTIPLRFTSPRDGDKTFGSVTVSGFTRPFHGIHCELHSGMLLSDGYTVAEADGEFNVVLSYDNDLVEFGQQMSVVAVSQASPDSVELHIDITQARRFPELPRGRTGRRAIVDNNTIALYEFAAPEIGPEDNIGAYTFMAAINGTAAPTPFSFNGTASFVPTAASGVMTMYNFNTSATFSRLERFSSDVMPNFVTGFTYKQKVRFAPIPGGVTTSCTVAYFQASDGYEWRVLANSNTGFSLSSVLDTVTFTQPTINFYDWNEITVRGRQLNTTHPTGSQATRYLELYVNDTKVSQAYANTIAGGTTVHYLGNAFTGSVFWTADFDYMSVDNTDPFIKTHVANSQGDPSRTLLPFNGPTSRPVNDPTVPFDHALRLNGTDHYAITQDPALDLVAPFTIEGWFRTNTFGATQNIVSKESSPTNGFSIHINSSDQLVMFVSNGSNNSLNNNRPQVDLNKWHNFAMVYTGSVLIGYYDGVEYDRLTAGFTANTAQDFAIGTDSTAPSGFFSGDIAQIKVSNRVVPAWEIHNSFYAVDDPVAVLPSDEHTIALFDSRNISGIGSRYIYSTHINATQNAPSYFDFSEDPSYYDKFFTFSSTSPDGYSGILDDGVSLECAAESGVTHTSFIDTLGKCRLTGNFDIIWEFEYPDKHPIPNGSANRPMMIRMFSTSNRETDFFYEEATSTLRMRSFVTAPSFGPDDSDIVNIGSQPNTLKIRCTREGQNYKMFYGINGADATTAMATDPEFTGPTGDLWFRVQNQVHSSVTNLGDGSYTVNLRSIDIKGVNGASGDGYLMHDTKGAAVAVTNPVVSPFGQAWNFDGVDDVMFLANHTDYNHTDLTIEVWAKPDLLHDGRIIGRENAPTNSMFAMDLGIDGYFAARVRDTDGNALTVQGGTYIAAKWQHFAMTYTAFEKTLRIFVNGIQIGRGSNANLIDDFSSNLGLVVGYNNSGGFIATPFDGDLASIRISNTARSALEIFNIVKGSKVRET